MKFQLALEKQESSIAPDHIWSNKDTDPTLPEERTWGMGTMLLYWMSDIIGIGSWQTASSLITIGLDWRQALIIKFLGGFINGIPLVLNGRIGALLHVPFPILVRASHGYQLGKFPIVSRVIVAMFWFAINSWNGGSCVRVMLGAIWPSFYKIHNGMPTSAGFTTQSMIAYLIYWIIQFPFVFIHPRRMQPLFIVKAIYVPIVAIATLVWTVKQAGGSGALLDQRPTISGNAYHSAWLLGLSSTVGSYSTLALNIPDFTRYTKGPNAVWIQLPFLPFLYVLNGVFGIVAASATQVFLGKLLWSPLDIAALWVSKGGRAAAFFAALGWLIATVSNNISANSISAANDLATLFPHYVDIMRGQIICCIIAGWCMVPWKILASGRVFLNFISGYALVLGPFCAIMIVDYYYTKKTRYDVVALYNAKAGPSGPAGKYQYNRFGTNWRALATIVATIPPTLPGLARTLSPKTVKIGAYDGINWIYSVSWMFTFTTSLILYTLLSWAFPHAESQSEHTVLATDDPRFIAHMNKTSKTVDDEEKVTDSKGSDYDVNVVPVVAK